MNSEQLPAITLASLSLGESGILQYTANHNLQMALLNLGIKQGAKLTIANIAPLGVPIAVAGNGTKMGKDERSIEIAKNAIKANLPNDTIAQITGLSLEQIETLRNNPDV